MKAKAQKAGKSKESTAIPQSSEQFEFRVNKNLEMPAGRASSDTLRQLRKLLGNLEVSNKVCIEYHKKFSSTITYILANEYHNKSNGRAFVTRKINDNYRGVWRVK